MAGPVQVVPQDYTFRDYLQEKAGGRMGVPTGPGDGIHGDTLQVSDHGLMPWSQKRAFDPGAYNVTNLDQRVAQSRADAARYDQRQGPLADTTQSNQIRGQQMTLADHLAAQANGQGPSLAQMQLQRGLDQNIATQMAMAASQRGAGGAGALRALGYQQGQARQQMAGDAATLQLNEQMQAQNQLGALLAGARGQDQQMSLADQQSRLGTMGLNDAQNRFYTQTGNDLYSQQMQARRAREQDAIQYEGMLRGVAVQGQQQATNTGGALLAAGGTALTALSDETKKTDIKPGGKDLGSFLDALTSSKYKYKDEADGEGEFWSPMAQDLEKTPVGRSMVIDTPRGKAVDYARGFGAYLAATADLHQRVKKLEGKGASNG
jgi:hypothetical protein